MIRFTLAIIYRVCVTYNTWYDNTYNVKTPIALLYTSLSPIDQLNLLRRHANNIHELALLTESEMMLAVTKKLHKVLSTNDVVMKKTQAPIIRPKRIKKKTQRYH